MSSEPWRLIWVEARYILPRRGRIGTATPIVETMYGVLSDTLVGTQVEVAVLRGAYLVNISLPEQEGRRVIGGLLY